MCIRDSYRYYVSCAKAQGRPETVGSVARVPAVEVEAIVLDHLRTEYKRRNLDEEAIDKSAASQLPDDELVTSLLERVIVHQRELRLTLKPTNDETQMCIRDSNRRLEPGQGISRTQRPYRLCHARARSRCWF